MSITDSRRNDAQRVRNSATQLAFDRAESPNKHRAILPAGEPHKNNGEEDRYRKYGSYMSFSKGLKHDSKTGLPITGEVDKLRYAIDDGFIQSFDNIGIGYPIADDKLKWHFHTNATHRRWESPTAGHVFDLQGPDAQAVTMPSAPALEDLPDELVAEMAEVYELALLRDVPFSAFSEVATHSHAKLDTAIAALKELPFYASGGNADRTRPQHLSRGNVFRGQTPGEQTGPYLSQFLLLGNGHLEDFHQDVEGKLQYGGIRIDQRVRVATPNLDYMTHWHEWLDVQHGANVINTMDYVDEAATDAVPFRFITTPRDLATYVHFDALYEAYLNAALWLLNVGAPRDPKFAKLLGESSSTEGFALFGGPHILTMVTEVATRALKAVRYQKFNNHLRARPEVVAARVAAADAGVLPVAVEAAVNPMRTALEETGLLNRVREHNAAQNARHADYLSECEDIAATDNLPLLPMAFAEGSPMHPAYGAGHATVAGACVTMLKAFFDEDAILIRDREGKHRAVSAQEFKDHAYENGWETFSYVPPKDNGECLEPSGDPSVLTVGHELNKLAANISIGRNMGGVHYYSDYIESMRMGEAIAAGILEEQALTYERIDPFVVGFRTFDNKECIIPEQQYSPKVNFA